MITPRRSWSIRRITPEIKSVKYTNAGNPDYTVNLSFDYPYTGFPSEAMIYFEVDFDEKQPFSTFTWTTPDGREFTLDNAGMEKGERYLIQDHINNGNWQIIQFEYQFIGE